jgi:hypothetical protein
VAQVSEHVDNCTITFWVYGIGVPWKFDLQKILDDEDIQTQLRVPHAYMYTFRVASTSYAQFTKFIGSKQVAINCWY